MKKSIVSLLVITLVILAAACSKNQKKVNSIEGAWRLEYVDGVELEDSMKMSYIFNQCRLKSKKNEGYCDVLISTTGSESIETGYKFTEKGTKLVFRDYVNEFSYTNTNTVDELLDSTLTITNSAAGNSVTLTFKRK